MPPVSERNLREIINSGGKQGPRFYIRGAKDVFVGRSMRTIKRTMERAGVSSILEKGRIMTERHGIVFESSDRRSSDPQTTVDLVIKKIGDSLNIRGRMKK